MVSVLRSILCTSGKSIFHQELHSVIYTFKISGLQTVLYCWGRLIPKGLGPRLENRKNTPSTFFTKKTQLLKCTEVLEFAQNNMKMFVGIARSCFDCFRRFSNLVRSKIGFVNLAEIICFRDKLFSKWQMDWKGKY